VQSYFFSIAKRWGFVGCSVSKYFKSKLQTSSCEPSESHHTWCEKKVRRAVSVRDFFDFFPNIRQIDAKKTNRLLLEKGENWFRISRNRKIALQVVTFVLNVLGKNGWFKKNDLPQLPGYFLFLVLVYIVRENAVFEIVEC